VHVKNREVKLISYKTYDQIIDIFTKPLRHDIFARLKTMLIMINPKNSSLRRDVDE